jgi:uncharacterized membrane protein
MTRRARTSSGASRGEPARQPGAQPAGKRRAGSATAASRAASVRRAAVAGDHHRRLAQLDAFRGLAIVAMVIYHFCFDLALNGWLTADFGEDWRWIAFRVPILGSFLFAAGISLGLAGRDGFDERRYWRRIGIVAAAAALVTAGSYLLFPDSYIYFGVLHGIAVMGVLGRLLLPLRAWLVALGIGIVAAGVVLRFPAFDQPWFQWIGMMTFKPRTEDYVPLFPWFGVFLVGAAAGVAFGRGDRAFGAQAWTPPPALGWLPWLGRHSLAVYLVHQPLLLGAMQAVKWLG